VRAGACTACHFHPLPLPHPLADEQDAWLGLIDPALATRPPNQATTDVIYPNADPAELPPDHTRKPSMWRAAGVGKLVA
jgi:hypothetical protein